MAQLWNERYEPLEVLGRGGQGKVIRALDHRHDRTVALKVRPAGSKAAREALLSEARILLSLRPHPNLPLVREDFFVGRRYVIVMDWVDGVDLESVLAARGDPGLAPSVVLQWISQVAQALDHLQTHDPPIVHGDVKPANCVLSGHGRVVLVDFGIAAPAGRGSRGRSGSRGYRAPEVSSGGELTPAADIFGLAATATTLLTGEAPGSSAPDWEGVAPHVAATLERALRHGLAVDPAKRPPSAGALVERMQYWMGSGLPEGRVTILVTGLAEDSPAWASTAEVTASVLTRYDQLVAQTVEGAGGRLVRSSGDGGTQSVFTLSRAAVGAALALQRAVVEEPWPAGAEPRVVAAVHCDEARIHEGEYTGPLVNRAHRLRSLATPGQVLLSSSVAQATAGSLPDGAALVDLGKDRHPGAERPEPVFGLRHPALPDSLSRLPASRPASGRRWWWAGAAAIGAAVVAAAVLVSASGGDRPATPGPDFRGAPVADAPSRPIYFESTRDGSRQLWAMNSNGQNARRLFGDPRSDSAENYLPRPSPDGALIAFVSERDGNEQLEIYVVNADGTNPRRLTNNPGIDTTPAWSPDGTKLAFTSDRGEGNEIYVMAVAGGDTAPLQQLTKVDGLAGYPVWSPDGSRIVFNSDHASGKNDLFVADSAGLLQAGTRLTHGKEHEVIASWSPDGRWIAYSGGGIPGSIGGGDIYIVDARTGDRRGLRRVTDLRAYSWAPRWSPDGRLLVFVSNVHEQTGNEIYVVAADAENAREATRLTSTSTADDQNPVW